MFSSSLILACISSWNCFCICSISLPKDIYVLLNISSGFLPRPADCVKSVAFPCSRATNILSYILRCCCSRCSVSLTWSVSSSIYCSWRAIFFSYSYSFALDSFLSLYISSRPLLTLSCSACSTLSLFWLPASEVRPMTDLVGLIELCYLYYPLSYETFDG